MSELRGFNNNNRVYEKLYSSNNRLNTSISNINSNISENEKIVNSLSTFTSIGQLTNDSDVMVSFTSNQDGILYFKFSNDNINYSTFPVNGFTIKENIHAFHTAVKGPRYFKWEFQNTSETNATINCYVYFGHFRHGNLPLDQPINRDADSIIVRSIPSGLNPTGNYVDNKQLGYIIDTSNILTTTDTGLIYLSDILDTIGYTQSRIELFSNINGELEISWYSDSTGNILIRQNTITYLSTNNLESLFSPIYTRYVKFKYTSNSDQNSFLFRVKLLTNSISAEIVGTNSQITNTMATQLNRNIIMGQTKSQNFLNTPVNTFGHLRVSLSDPLTAFGSLKTEQDTVILYETFHYTINTRKLIIDNLINNNNILGGTGTGLLVDYESSGGVITKIFPTSTNRGNGYSLNDVITINGGNNDATAIVKSITLSGEVLAIDINNPGSGYTNPNSVVIQENNMLKLTQENLENRKICVYTKKFCKYQPGTGITSKFTTVFGDKNNCNYQYMGIGDKNNGFFIGYQNSNFGILHRKNGIEEFITQDNFNIDKLNGEGNIYNKSNININPQNGNVYQINFQWLGFGCIKFFVEDGNTSDFELFHIIKYPNNFNIPNCFNPSFPITLELGNTTNNTTTSLYTASLAISLEGNRLHSDDNFTYNVSNSSGDIIVLQNNKYFYNKINKTIVNIKKITLANESNQSMTVSIILNPVITNIGWTSINNLSSISYGTKNNDTSISNGTILETYIINKDSGENINYNFGEIELYPNDIIVINTNKLTSASIIWTEDQ